MVLIFAWAVFLCAFSVLAVRQAADALSAAETQVTVREQRAVFGHTALNTIKVYSVKAQNGVCRDVVKKVSTFAQEELMLSSDARRSIDVSVDRAFLNDKDKRGQRQLFEAFALLDQSDLRDAMQTGEIWTLSDQDMLVECETGQFVRLEEEDHTDSGAELFQGDMLVPAEAVSASAQVKTDLSLLQTETLVAEGSRWAGNLWGTSIFFCFEPTLDERAKKAFLEAVEHTSKQVPCLRFTNVGYNDGSSNAIQSRELQEKKVSKGAPGSCLAIPSVIVQDTDPLKCWSYVGRRFSFQTQLQSQPLNLGSPCWTMAIAAHELGHTLGMVHEQSRKDRDEYIIVHWDHIKSGAEHNFKREILYSWEEGSYDPLSLMHYDPRSFTSDPSQPTITAKTNPRLTRLFGQRLGWSEQDVLELFEKCCQDGEHYMVQPRHALYSPRPLVEQKKLLTKLVGEFKPKPTTFGYIMVRPLRITHDVKWDVFFHPKEDDGSCTTKFQECEKASFGLLSLLWTPPSDDCGMICSSCSELLVITCPGVGREALQPGDCWFKKTSALPENFWDELWKGSCTANVIGYD